MAIINDTYSVVKSEVTRGHGQLAADFEYLLDKLKKLLSKKKHTPAFDALDKTWLDSDGNIQSEGETSKEGTKEGTKDGKKLKIDPKSFHAPAEQDKKLKFNERSFLPDTTYLSDGGYKTKGGKKSTRKSKSDDDADGDLTDTDNWEHSPRSGRRSHLNLKLSGFLKQ